ncbi:hypothetical protein [Nocardia africana]|uniref:Uncharacterized protein n=1 Tax=Nocardia africana TaxID=134964 RepID=A0ABW6NDX8_9NOCA
MRDVSGPSESGLSADLPSYVRIRVQFPESAAQSARRTSAHRDFDPFMPPNPPRKSTRP